MTFSLKPASPSETISRLASSKETKKVIFIIGLNKVAQNVEAAIARARSTASPINAQRFDINTPCKVDGVCHNCNSAESICSYIHLLRNSRTAGRHVVVLVGEDLGY